MEAGAKLFLNALKAALENRKVDWSDKISPGEWEQIFKIAGEHHVLPLIYNAVRSCAAADSLNEEQAAMLRRQSIQAIAKQTRQTLEFLKLYQFLQESGVSPCVVKGIICRNIYPNPDYRISGDEDLFIDSDQFEKCHNAMIGFGMVLIDEKQDIFAAEEVSYRKPGSGLYIELHKKLFPSDSEAYGDFNCFFETSIDHCIWTEISGIKIATLNETDHFFFLICHAFKHFLHSGFGIRQICDIVKFAEVFGSNINWDVLYQNCCKIHADVFTAALLQIGKNYLNFDYEAAGCSKIWKKIAVDERALLEDLLEGGVFGSSSKSRQHSSSITLNAVATQRKGKHFSGNVMKALFPSVKALSGRYSYLRKHPYLLPIAWLQRIAHYRKELSAGHENNDALESLKIGNKRIGLLKQYGIIE